MLRANECVEFRLGKVTQGNHIPQRIRIEEVAPIHTAVDRDGLHDAHDDRPRIPLDHEVRVKEGPQCTKLRLLALRKTFHPLVPCLIFRAQPRRGLHDETDFLHVKMYPLNEPKHRKVHDRPKTRLVPQGNMTIIEVDLIEDVHTTAIFMDCLAALEILREIKEVGMVIPCNLVFPRKRGVSSDIREDHPVPDPNRDFVESLAVLRKSIEVEVRRTTECSIQMVCPLMNRADQTLLLAGSRVLWKRFLRAEFRRRCVVRCDRWVNQDCALMATADIETPDAVVFPGEHQSSTLAILRKGIGPTLGEL